MKKQKTEKKLIITFRTNKEAKDAIKSFCAKKGMEEVGRPYPMQEYFDVLVQKFFKINLR